MPRREAAAWRERVGAVRLPHGSCVTNNQAPRTKVEQSERRQAVNELLGKETLTHEERANLTEHTKRIQELEGEHSSQLVERAGSAMRWSGAMAMLSPYRARRALA